MRPFGHPLDSGYTMGWPHEAAPDRAIEPPPEGVDPSRYVELHCHSCFSLREGASTPLELVLRAKELGYSALALTDHDSLAGAMQFAQAAKAWDLQPVIGAEVTLMDDSHLTLLCETPRGYANLSRLLTRANLGSPRGNPSVGLEWLPY